MARRSETSITAADANRTFSEVLRRVREGRSYIVTSHGRPVARIVPYEGADMDRDAAKDRLWDRLRSQPVLNLGKLDRESLYEDGE